MTHQQLWFRHETLLHRAVVVAGADPGIPDTFKVHSNLRCVPNGVSGNTVCASACAFTTAADCTGVEVRLRFTQNRAVAISGYQCNPSCVPAFHRVGGWGVRPATRFVRFNFAVFPAASRSLILFSGHPCRHALHLSRGERGGESARLPVLYPQAVCCHRCQFSLALRLGSSFALNSFPNFWLGYIGYFFGQ